MKKNPVMANPIAIARRLRTTKRSALSPVIRGGSYETHWRAGPVAAGTSHGRSEIAPMGPSYGATRARALPMIRLMIDREQVLHVARLARLQLSDAEVERMSSELSGILEHVEHINELDLDGVEPTSHVIALENVLRPDEPRPSWSRDEMLERAPDPAGGSYRVPSPQA
jgi:aspartyl-tRNA(Asn)/glutamyl-tRNA(Gln) amidotransferase subunit C